MDVSIIFINYNTYELTRQSIASVLKYTKGIEYEIILIDNNSSDNSLALLKNDFCGQVIFVQSGSNLGTSRAFNLALEKCCGRYVLWLNTDILIKNNFIQTLYDFMESCPTCGICGGNITDFNDLPTHSYRKQLPSLKTFKLDQSIFVKIFKRIFKKFLSSEFNYTGKPMPVGYVTGADMMIRKSIFDLIGGFDPDIFMYAEESEFTFRMTHKTEYNVMSVPNATICHLEGASFNGRSHYSQKRCSSMMNGSYIYFTKCYGAKVAKKYMAKMKSSSRKFMIFYKILGKKQRYLINKENFKLAKEYLYNYKINK